jgi:hypothetical protein
VAILDSAGHVIAVLVGRPSDDPSWEQTHHEAADLLESARPRCQFSKQGTNHQRGHFPALATGISHGGGQMHPRNLSLKPVNAKILGALAQHPAFVHHQGAFSTWAPRLYDYYNRHVQALIDHDKTSTQPFHNSIWATTTFNFGPATACFKHKDYLNLPFGLCGITSLGRFDPKRGRHLVLWGICQVVEFPPGSTVLIPSTAIAHSNVGIQGGECCYSFTQYTAGRIFCWVDQGFQTVKRHQEQLSPDELHAELLELASQGSMGLGLFSTLDELKLSYMKG